MFDSITHWHWLAFGTFLLILEVFVGGFFFLWLSVAAVMVGLALLATPHLAMTYQILIFALFSMATVTISRRYIRGRPKSEQPLLNRRGEQYVGRVFTLVEPIVNGVGKVRVDDSTWKIHGDDWPIGTKVRVTGVDGVVLRVEKAQ